MLLQSGLPKFMWAEAINTVAYVLNRKTTRRNPKATPFEVWLGRKPTWKHLRVFRSVAYAHIPKKFRKKLDKKAVKTILVGYERTSKNYRLYNPKTRKIIISRDVVFNEKSNYKVFRNMDPKNFIFPKNFFEILDEETPAQESIIETLEESTEDDWNSCESGDLNQDQVPKILNQNEELPVDADSDAINQENASNTRQLRDRATLELPKRYRALVVDICEPQT